MKKIILNILGAALIVSATSCGSNILDENAVSVLTPSLLQTSQGVEAGVTGAYSGLRQLYGNEGDAFGTEAGTDAFTNGIQSSSGLNDYDNNALTPLNDGSNSFRWSVCYTQINTINGVLQYGPSAQGLTAARLAQLIAEAKLLRAHFYFSLVQDFGDVPLQTTFVDAPSKDFTRSPQADIYTQILKDLADALATIADKPAQPGRLTRATALHMLAKVYLTRATSPAKQSTDYAMAAQYAKELIDNQGRYGLGLEADVADVHREGNENGKEVIMNAQFNGDATVRPTAQHEPRHQQWSPVCPPGSYLLPTQFIHPARCQRQRPGVGADATHHRYSLQQVVYIGVPRERARCQWGQQRGCSG
jgi:hypothetical protein